ncbi:hypothetical protein HF086_015964, partial [Spodoptera exigua]
MSSSKENNTNNEAHESLLYSARHGELSVVKAMLEAKDEGKLTIDINCKGKNKTNLGWTPLHLATYFGHKDVVEALLEAGANVDEVNDTGDSALHKASFIGNEAVVQRGVLLYYGSRAEAARGGTQWRGRKYLDGATLSASDTDPAAILLRFSDGDTHRLAVQAERDVPACRQQWITALNEHIAYSGHYLWAGASPDTAREATEDLEDECKPLGSMQDALTAATNSLALLDTQLRECAAIVAALDKSLNVGTSLHHSAYMIERNRVLEEALAALARTHHALEMSVAEELTKSKRKKKSKSSSTLNDSKENFFDVFEESEDEDDTLVTAGLSSPLGALSPWGSSPDLTRRTPIGNPNERGTGGALLASSVRVVWVPGVAPHGRERGLVPRHSGLTGRTCLQEREALPQEYTSE